MKFAIFVTTQSRSEEMQQLLNSLWQGTHQDFEVWALLQEGFDRSALAAYETDERIHLLEGPRMSLSKARNLGMPMLKGDVVWFADDDCHAPPDSLAFVAARFAEDPALQVLSIRSVDETGALTASRFPPEPCPITPGNVWRTAISYTLFFRAEAVAQVGTFDESLGVGAATPWQSGEETDYVLRGLKLGLKTWYFSGAGIIHPDKTGTGDKAALDRHAAYARGAGRVIHKNALGSPYVLGMLAKTLLGCAYLTVRGQRKSIRQKLVTARHRTAEYFKLRLGGLPAAKA